jgi:pimeloyl-ACP methyl ester carboxylesterase
MREAERTVVVDGIAGRYAAVGAGPPVVILATMLALARTYRDTARLLGRAYRVVTLELPGTGRSAHRPATWDTEDYARWTAGAFAALGIGRAEAVIGHSCSGAVVVALAALHPDRVARLVLADPVGAGGRHSLTRILIGRAIDAVIELRLTARGWPQVAQNIVQHPRNFAYQTWLAAKGDVSGYAECVRAPVLIGWGAHDWTLPASCRTALARMLPNARCYVCAAGSHDWIVARPAEFAAVTRRFIEAT